jgi:crossover junction endodeoxyribonuclease RusA
MIATYNTYVKSYMKTLTIPYPPSVNTYWGFHGHRRFLTPKAVQFKKTVAHIVSQQQIKFGNQRLEISITLYPPDRRVRDIDNVVKSTFDALVQANAFADDSCIDVLLVQRGTVIKGGKADVTIKVLE